MLLFLALSFYPSPAWPGLIRAPVLTALRTAPVITIKQLLSLDIIKAGLYVEGRVNPQDPSLGVEEGAWGGGDAVSSGSYQEESILQYIVHLLYNVQYRSVRVQWCCQFTEGREWRGERQVSGIFRRGIQSAL